MKKYIVIFALCMVAVFVLSFCVVYACEEPEKQGNETRAKAAAIELNQYLNPYLLLDRKNPVYYGGHYIEDGLLHIKIVYGNDKAQKLLEMVLFAYQDVVVFEKCRYSYDQLYGFSKAAVKKIEKLEEWFGDWFHFTYLFDDVDVESEKAVVVVWDQENEVLRATILVKLLMGFDSPIVVIGDHISLD